MTTTHSLILCYPDSLHQAQHLSEYCEIPYAVIKLHHFPDRESQLTLPVTLPEHVILMRSLDNANQKLLEVLMSARSLNAQSVKQLTLIAPYLCYMRQDTAFHPGEVISQQVIGGLLAEHFHTVITVDAHLHRVKTLPEAIPAKTALNVSATQPIADFLQFRFKNPLLIGPDSESLQWVQAIASAMPSQTVEFCVARKVRHGDCDVDIQLPSIDFSKRDIILVDDVISTGHTLEKTALSLFAHDPNSVSVMITHALFVGDALQRLNNIGIQQIWSTDSISHSTNALRLASVLGDSLSECINLVHT
ncbi:MAG: ribose-phosphate diphosphokinase [Gammaproteobacteria bacterium]|nr:ribose-phosphate diphosphokinase [Gammaproteobacteria bacterium]